MEVDEECESLMECVYPLNVSLNTVCESITTVCVCNVCIKECLLKHG